MQTVYKKCPTCKNGNVKDDSVLYENQLFVCDKCDSRFKIIDRDGVDGKKRFIYGVLINYNEILKKGFTPFNGDCILAVIYDSDTSNNQ